MTVRNLIAVAVIAVALAGCSLAPTYRRPEPAIAPSWPAGDAYLRASEATLPRIGYRDIFLDPALRALIERALANNQDLKIALANVGYARGQLRVQRAQLLPRIDGSAGVTVGDVGSARSTASGSTDGGTSASYDVGIGITAFELDLFGRVRSLSAAALQDYLASEAAVRAARVTLIAEVANAYLTLAADRTLLAIARDTVTTAARSVELTRSRLEGGVAPRSDVRQAETVLAQARADVASLTTLVAQDRNALELLVGTPLGGVDSAAAIDDVDRLLTELPAGLDSNILLRRPDVLEAEYRLRSANAVIGAARAAFFPQISLTATAGLASKTLASLFSSGAFAWSIQPSALVPIFDAGVNRGNLESARAVRDSAIAQYQKAIQTAFREVADALARRGTIGAQFDAQAQLEAAALDSYQLAEARYRAGVDSFLSSLDAQRTLYSARRALASTKLIRATNLVELYRALGGDA